MVKKKKVKKKTKGVSTKKKPAKKSEKSSGSKRSSKKNMILSKRGLKNGSKLMERVKSGTKNFDKLVEGGFERDSTNLIVGGSGSGKTIFGMQFLLEGIKSGEKCLYISFEEQKESFYKNFKGLKIDLQKYESSGKFFFLEYSPQKVKTMLEEGGGAIETLVLTKSVTRIVIDSISSFTLLFDGDLEKKEAALSLFNLLKGWDCTTVLISDEDSLDESESSKVIDQEVDSIIHMYLKRGAKQRRRFLEIRKMRGTNHSLSTHPFRISNSGLSIGSASSKK